MVLKLIVYVRNIISFFNKPKTRWNSVNILAISKKKWRETEST